MFQTKVTRDKVITFPDNHKEKIVELGGIDLVMDISDADVDSGTRSWPTAENAAAWCEFMLAVDGVHSAVVTGEV
jgi:hypothetical protein